MIFWKLWKLFFRILFFPIYLPLVYWRWLREPEPDPRETKIHELHRKGYKPLESHWAIQILDKNGKVLGSNTARMIDEEEGIILYAEFAICGTVTIHTSRAVRRGKTVGECVLPTGPILATIGNLIKIRHALFVETKTERKPDQSGKAH